MRREDSAVRLYHLPGGKTLAITLTGDEEHRTVADAGHRNARTGDGRPIRDVSSRCPGPGRLEGDQDSAPARPTNRGDEIPVSSRAETAGACRPAIPMCADPQETNYV